MAYVPVDRAISAHDLAKRLLAGPDRPVDLYYGNRKVSEVVHMEYLEWPRRWALTADDYDGGDP